ncbi:MAG: hypothetical protein LBJ61_01915 [Deltaproteobacteria bacterium]|nr:hypothetical protein [Deltaproteobacteria bacterium]
MRGWANYYYVGAVSKPFKLIGKYCVDRFRHWLKRTHKLKTKGYKKWPEKKLFMEYGLLDIRMLIPTYPSAKARQSNCGSRAGKPHVRFDEGELET